MKISWLTISVSALLINGCNSMYNNDPAPVVDRSSYQNQQPSQNPSATIRPEVVRVAPQQNNQQAQYQQQQYQQQQQLYRQQQQQQQAQYQQQQLYRQQQQQQYVATANTPLNATASNPYAAAPNPYDDNQQRATANQDGWNSASPTQENSAAPQQQIASAEPAVVIDDPSMRALRPPAEEAIAAQSQAAVAAVDGSNAPKQPTSDETIAQQVATAAKPDGSAAASGESAVSLLLKKASASLGKSDMDGAVAYLENAQRIEPQNSKILYDIANIRFHQGKWREAESFASRAVQVGGNNDMMRKSWSLIANARKKLGDNQGAITAAEKSLSLAP